MSFVSLKISKEVSATTEDCVSHTVADGKKLFIDKFVGEAAFTTNAVCKLVWDYGGAGEQVIWTTKGSSKMPFTHEVTGDGVKKLAVCLDNGTAGALVMSAYMEGEEG